MRRVLKIAGLLLLALVVVIPGCVLLNLSDPPIDDSDLRVERGDPADPANGFHHFDTVTEALWSPPSHLKSIAQHVDGERWDDGFVADVLAKNEAMFHGLADLIAARDFDLPPSKFGDNSIDLRWTYRLQIAQLLALKAAEASRRGDVEASIDASLQAIHLGDRFQRARGSHLINEMSAVAMKMSGLASIERNLPRFAPTAEDALAFEAEIDGLRSDLAGRSAVWSVEYETIASALAEIAGGERPFDSDVATGPLASYPYLFKINETKALLADYYRDLGRQASLPCEEQHPYPLPEWNTAEKIKTIVRPNSVGRILFVTSAIDPKHFEQHRCAADTRIGAVGAMVALRAYEVEHGQLPGSLEDLRPRYLTAIPVDAFDGEAIAFDRETRTLGKIRPARLGDARATTRFIVPVADPN